MSKSYHIIEWQPFVLHCNQTSGRMLRLEWPSRRSRGGKRRSEESQGFWFASFNLKPDQCTWVGGRAGALRPRAEECDRGQLLPVRQSPSRCLITTWGSVLKWLKNKQLFSHCCSSVNCSTCDISNMSCSTSLHKTTSWECKKRHTTPSIRHCVSQCVNHCPT